MPFNLKSLFQVKNELSYVAFSPKQTCIQVAGLCICFDSTSCGDSVLLPLSYSRFFRSLPASECHHRLDVKIDRDSKALDFSKDRLICQTDIWDLRQTDQQHLVFSTKMSRFSRQLSVNHNYTMADLTGHFKTVDGNLWHPLENLDMLLSVNWLGEKGDLALHASGVILNGKGFAFLGKSGAGKSTLASALVEDHQAMVLGEDQIILRYVDGKFWIYGTPWHENPAMCSPLQTILNGVVFLDREDEIGLKKISAMDGISRIMQTSFVPYYRPELIETILDRLTLLAATVPFYCLNYPLGQDVCLNYLQNV